MYIFLVTFMHLHHRVNLNTNTLTVTTHMQSNQIPMIYAYAGTSYEQQAHFIPFPIDHTFDDRDKKSKSLHTMFAWYCPPN